MNFRNWQNHWSNFWSLWKDNNPPLKQSWVFQWFYCKHQRARCQQETRSSACSISEEIQLIGLCIKIEVETGIQITNGELLDIINRKQLHRNMKWLAYLKHCKPNDWNVCSVVYPVTFNFQNLAFSNRFAVQRCFIRDCDVRCHFLVI